MKLSTEGYLRVVLLNSTMVFLNSVSENLFWTGLVWKLETETEVLNETRFIGVFRVADSEFDNFFLKFHSQNTFFWGYFVPKLQSALFYMKLNLKGYSRVLIMNSKIYFLNSVPKIVFRGKFDHENSKYFFLKWN